MGRPDDRDLPLIVGLILHAMEECGEDVAVLPYEEMLVRLANMRSVYYRATIHAGAISDNRN